MAFILSVKQTFQLCHIVYNDAGESIQKETSVLFSLSFWFLSLHLSWRCGGPDGLGNFISKVPYCEKHVFLCPSIYNRVLLQPGNQENVKSKSLSVVWIDCLLGGHVPQRTVLNLFQLFRRNRSHYLIPTHVPASVSTPVVNNHSHSPPLLVRDGIYILCYWLWDVEDWGTALLLAAETSTNFYIPFQHLGIKKKKTVVRFYFQ